MRKDTIPTKIKKWHIIALTTTLSILIVIGAYFYFSYEEQTIHYEKHNELKAIAELKISQIANWNKEKLTDVKVFSQSPFFINGLENWLGAKSNLSVKSEILKRLALINADSLYSNVMITDPNGKLLLSLESKDQQIDTATEKFILKAVAAKKILSTDLYECRTHQEIHLDYIAPVTGKNNNVIATLILRINPDKYLYPLINEWPSPSKTSETMIVRKDGDSVLYLNELTHKKNTALKLRLPLTRKETPAVQAVLGYKGIFEGTSYHGTNVLAYISPVEGTQWIMIAQEDDSEIYAGLHFRVIVIILFTFLLIVTLSVGLIWYYHYRQRNIYRELFVKEKELREYHEEFRTILYSIGDGVITTDMDGNVKQMNYVSEELTGWSETEAIGKPIEEVFKIISEGTRSKVENPIHKVLKEGVIIGLANHTLLISKDGRETPIADSGAPIRNEQGEIEGVVLVFRDKSEEHKAEKLIHQSEARLKRAELASKAGNWELHLDTKMMIASEGAAKIYGVDRTGMDYEIVKKVPLPEYRSLMDNALKNLIEKNIPYDIEFKIKTVDTGEIKDIHSVAHYDKENKILFGVIQDITERKKAETALVDNEEKMRTIVEGTPYLFFYTQDNNANITYISPSIEKITGYSVDQWLGQKHWFVTDSGINKLAKEKTHAHLRGESVKETIFIEITHANGNNILLEVYENPIIKENKVVGLQGIARDITEQKKLERERFQLLSILENSLNEIYVFDSATLKFEYVNQGALKNIGYSLDEMKNLTPVDIKPEYTGKTFRQAIEPLINGQQEKLILETIHKRKDGTNYPVEIHLQLHKLENKSVFFAIINDITERKKTENALKEREAFLNNLLSTMPIPVFYKDTKGNYIDANNSFVSLFGYSKEQLIGKTVFDLYPPELAETYFAKDKELLDSGGTQVYETKFMDAKGLEHDVLIHKTIYKNVHDKIAGLIGAILDITERKRAEEALRESEEKFKQLVWDMQVGVLLQGPQAEILLSNPKSLELLGLTEDQILGKTSFDPSWNVIHEDGSPFPGSTHPVPQAIASRQSVRNVIMGVYRPTTKDRVWLLVDAEPQLNEDGTVRHVICTFINITERKRAEEALRQSEERLRTTLYSIGDGVIATDKYGKITQSNPIAEDLTGWSEQEAKNKPLEEIFKIINETTRSSVENPVHKVLKEGKIVGLANHTLLISKDGTEIPIADSGAPIRNENGDIDGVVLVFRDQLKERAAQKILEESEAQLKQSQRVARIGYFIFDIKNDSWTSSEMLDELFGIDKNYNRTAEGWLNLIHPEQREEMTLYLTNHILKEKKEFNKEYKIQRDNDKVALWVHGLGTLEFDNDGNLVKMFGTIQDVTEIKKSQNLIETSLKEKEILLKEIHHRVKNNFQRIISLIALQTELIDDQKVLDIFEDLQNRLRTMSLIHELMYGTGDFVGVDVKDYITRLTNYLVKTYSSSGNVKLNLDLESHSLDLETIIPCGLITNEIVTNSLKYAFPNEAEGTVNISFKKVNGDFCLEFFDNGIGIKNKIDFENINSLGLRLVDLLAKQLRGTLEVVQPDNGLQFIIKFKGEF